MATGGGAQLNHYRIIEKLLYNYKRLERLVKREADYLSAGRHAKSKYMIVYAPGGNAFKTDEDATREIERERLTNYERTAARFREIDSVIALFRDSREFIVIRMYYFNEDPDGNERAPDSQKYTWEEIAFELSERGVLRDEKTARKWRTKIITEIAICVFGLAAAVTSDEYRSRNA